MNIVILAAGMGKRMRSALPKVLHPLAGKPLLSHVIATAQSLEPRRLIVVVGHGATQVQESVANPGIVFAEQAQQLGTGHAVQQAASLLDDGVPTLVLYGDVPLTRPTTLRALIDEAGGNKLGILTVDLADPTGYGRIVRDAEAQVVRIVEQKDATTAERAIREINTGIIVAPTARLKAWLTGLSNNNAQGEYYLTDVVERAVAEGVEVVTAQPAAEWETLGVNSKAQLAELERIYQRNAAQAQLDAGVTLADPSRFDVRGSLVCGSDVFIDVGCVFEGNVQLADNVSIGPHCVIRNATIGEGARIDAFSHIEQADIGAQARIGPYARLRPGTSLADGVHIGNFVEVKNSVMGADSKANHLAYVGDSDVGARVNIGAGTITCNYDGANKHRTVIEDDVFVGSDTQLVAPVRVGRGGTIAAGTTVWKDTPAGALVMNEKTQVSKDGWVRPVKKK